MKKKPIVGMTYSEMAVRDNEMRVRTYCTRKYYQALQNAGARVVLLPPVSAIDEMNAYLDLIDGLLFPGGEDVDPRFQNEDPSPKLGIVNPLRDEFEIGIAGLAHERKVPTLGICRGLQVMTIALGGSVYQDIGGLNGIQHSQNSPRWATSHRVNVEKSSFIGKIAKSSEIFTNSFHHQSINIVPKSLRVVGMAADGIIEAVESVRRFPYWGVQWHPEELANSQDHARNLFDGFVKAIKN